MPADSPSARVDTTGVFPFVGALAVDVGGISYRGSAVAIAPDWLLTAAHNLDLNDDGRVDAGWSGAVHLPGLGVFSVLESFLHPDFTGFANPTVNDDLALLRLGTPLPADLGYPGLGRTLSLDDVVTLVGFGRSGYGDYGYTTSASLSIRRSGQNVIDAFFPDDEGSGAMEVFRYDFDDPSTTGQVGGSLGNTLETIIGPGDSGGPVLRANGNQWQLVGINTFTEGYGGRFGDIGGGVVLAPYLPWIQQTTGLLVPEPGTAGLFLIGIVLLSRFSRLSNRTGTHRPEGFLGKIKHR